MLVEIIISWSNGSITREKYHTDVTTAEDYVSMLDGWSAALHGPQIMGWEYAN